MAAPASPEERKDPPGRPRIKSTGRGGAGNMSEHSGVRHTEEYPPTRGLELAVEGDTTKPLGRGGVGNILTQTRTRAAARFTEGHPHTQAILTATLARTAAYERSIIQQTSTEASGVRASGRGGAGNISRRRAQGAGQSTGPRIRLFKKKKKPRRATSEPPPPAAAEDAEACDSPVCPREDKQPKPSRSRRIHALLRLHRKPRPPAPSLSPAMNTTNNNDTSASAAPAVSAPAQRHLSILSIQTNISSLSYTRLSGISLPPSPFLPSPSDASSPSSPSSASSSAASTASDAASTSSSTASFELELEPPDSDTASYSTAPSSLEEKDRARSPFRCVFDFPDVPAASCSLGDKERLLGFPAAGGRLHEDKEKDKERLLGGRLHGRHARSASTPSLPTLYEHRASGSFLELEA